MINWRCSAGAVRRVYVHTQLHWSHQHHELDYFRIMTLCSRVRPVAIYGSLEDHQLAARWWRDTRKASDDVCDCLGLGRSETHILIISLFHSSNSSSYLMSSSQLLLFHFSLSKMNARIRYIIERRLSGFFLDFFERNHRGSQLQHESTAPAGSFSFFSCISVAWSRFKDLANSTLRIAEKNVVFMCASVGSTENLTLFCFKVRNWLNAWANYITFSPCCYGGTKLDSWKIECSHSSTDISEIIYIFWFILAFISQVRGSWQPTLRTKSLRQYALSSSSICSGLPCILGG